MDDVRDRAAWRRRLDDLAAHPQRWRCVLHPVVDVAAGRVAGYELLSRFDSVHGPEEWFAAAAALGRSAQLDRAVLADALRRREQLPHGTFLTVNTCPTSLLDPRVVAELLAHDLTGLVVELTEHSACDPAALVRPLAALRSAGAKVALDDVGTGHSGLLRMAVVRPEVVKVDLQLVRGVERDPVKRSLVQFLGECADRLDAWIVAEGVETTAELDVLRSMGVPLVQGFLLARPQDSFVELGPAARELLGRHRPPAAGAVEGSVGALTRRVTTARTLDDALRRAAAREAPVVVLDTADVPQVVVLPADRAGDAPRVAGLDLVLAPETSVADVAARAVTRPREVRFDPLVCTDASGRYLGVVGVEDVVLDLARGERRLRAVPTGPVEPTGARVSPAVGA